MFHMFCDRRREVSEKSHSPPPLVEAHAVAALCILKHPEHKNKDDARGVSFMHADVLRYVGMGSPRSLTLNNKLVSSLLSGCFLHLGGRNGDWTALPLLLGTEQRNEVHVPSDGHDGATAPLSFEVIGHVGYHELGHARWSHRSHTHTP